MHSRIFQLKPERMTDENKHELAKADDFVDNNCFLGPIADYVSDDCDRREDFDDLISELERVIGTGYEKYFSWHYAEDGTDMPEAYIIFNPGFKKAYMQKQYDTFIEQTDTMTLENFMCSLYVRRLEDAICDKFGFYITEKDGIVLPLDKFIRAMPDDEECKYWLWGTVDYHA